jgi:Uma2 family endonuclease
MMALPREQQAMTAAEFAALPESSDFIELIEGEVIVSPTPFVGHQRAIRLLTRSLEAFETIGEVFVSPLEIHFDEHTVLIPDVYFVRHDNPRCTIQDGKYHAGPPDLVVEVLSQSTARRDRGQKMRLYAQFGVPEYWIVDGANATLEQYVRGEAGAYALAGVFGDGETLSSPALGVSLTLAVFA